MIALVLERYLKRYAQAFAKTDRDMWNYEDGCVLIGLMALYEATGEESYFQAVKTFMDRYILADGTIRRYDMSAWNVDMIPSGRALFPLYARTGDMRYRAAIETLMEQLRGQPRTKTGSFWHKAIYPNQVWLDGLYMALPFYTMYENAFGGSGYGDIALQFENVRKTLFDEKERLHYHAWNETRDVFWADKKTGLSQNFWSRAIGWHLMALVDVYGLMPETQQQHRETLAALFREAMDGMLLYQDGESGLFYQLTALPDLAGNYLETSASLMVAYALLKGVRLGVLIDARYQNAAEAVLFGIMTRKMAFSNGRLSLTGICKGAGLGPEGNFKRDGSAAYYLSEEVVCDEQKGVGVCMMAYAQWLLRSREAGGAVPDYPTVQIFTKAYDPIMPAEIAALKARGGKG